MLFNYEFERTKSNGVGSEYYQKSYDASKPDLAEGLAHIVFNELPAKVKPADEESKKATIKAIESFLFNTDYTYENLEDIAETYKDELSEYFWEHNKDDILNDEIGRTY